MHTHLLFSTPSDAQQRADGVYRCSLVLGFNMLFMSGKETKRKRNNLASDASMSATPAGLT